MGKYKNLSTENNYQLVPLKLQLTTNSAAGYLVKKQHSPLQTCINLTENICYRSTCVYLTAMEDQHKPHNDK